MKERIEDEHWKGQFPTDVLKRLEEREQELLAYREQIQKQEMQLDEYRSKLKSQQYEREMELQKELEARTRHFNEREKMLSTRQREFEEHLVARENASKEMQLKLEKQLAAREAELHSLSVQLKKEKERYNEESRKKIEETSNDYVSEALEILSKKEIEFHSRSKFWAALGAVSLLGGLVFFIYITITTFSTLPEAVTWQFITFSAIKGLIALLLFAALAKYSLLFSNSYMREALKNADRRHAINFGKFYLESYGAAAEWSQVKEAFEHWNITGDGSFHKPEDSQLDITALEKIACYVERISNALPTKSA